MLDGKNARDSVDEYHSSEVEESSLDGHGSPIVRLLSVLVLVIGASVLAYGLLSNRSESHAVLPLPDDLGSLEPALVEVIKQCLQDVRQNPDDAEALGRLAMVYEVHRYREQAVACYSLASAADPSDPRWRYFIGVIHRDEGRLAEAEAAFADVIAREPNYSPVYQRLGTILMEQKRYQEASEAFTQATRAGPEQPAGYIGLGRVRLEQGMYGEAIALATKAITLMPSDCEGHHLLGMALRKTGRLEEARAVFERCTDRNERFVYDPWRDSLKPDKITRSGRRDRARHLLSKGQADAALPILEGLVSGDADDVVSLNLLGVSYLFLRRPDDARTVLSRALQIDDQKSLTHVNLSAALLALGDHSSALRHAEEGARLAPMSDQAFINQARALVRLQRFDEAATVFDHVREIDGRSVVAHRGQCKILLRLGRLNEAVDPCEAAVRATPDAWRDRLALGRLYANLGLFEEAVETLSVADKLNPGNPKIKESLAIIRSRSEEK